MRFAVSRPCAALALAGACLAGARPVRAQTPQRPDSLVRAVSLADAIRIAEQRSPQMQLARAGVLRARGQQYEARSQFLPQVYGNAGYTRTLRSQFEGAFGGSSSTTTQPDTAPVSVCAPFIPSNATVAQRDSALASAVSCQQASSPFGSLRNLPFGQKNQWSLGLQVTQNLFAGGRLIAQNQVANAGREQAELALTSQRAQLELDVAQAYYDAALGDRLLVIAESSLVQTETAYRQTQLAAQVGNAAQFDLLRAQVTRDNQRPVVIQARTSRDLAYLRLKQLLDLPLADSVRLTTDLQDTVALSPVRLAAELAADSAALGIPAAADTSAADRNPVLQAEQNVRIQKGLLRVTRAQRLPALQLTSQYGRVAYPSGMLPDWNSFLQNWTVGVGLTIPIFTGGYIRGQELVQEASVQQAEAQLRQTRELAELDARSALAQLAQAQSQFAASAGTAEQATKAYGIAEVRYREGISTQVELAQSRILLQQAMANRANAARDLQVARMRLALLRDLPLQQGSAAQQQQLMQQLMQQQGTSGAGQQGTAPGGSAQSGTQATSAALTSNRQSGSIVP